MDTLRVRLTMQPQHEPIRNLTSILHRSQMKSHEKRYNDIYRLSFSVTACIEYSYTYLSLEETQRNKDICDPLHRSLAQTTPRRINTTF
jgi:hypothetical protein